MMEEKIALIKFLILICDNTTCSSNKLRALCRKEYIYIFKKNRSFIYTEKFMRYISVSFK